MQFVNDDMDDLFRRAGENYPLNTNGADWNKVMQGLETSREKGLPQRVVNLDRYFWMAAIFLVLVCTTFIQKTESISKSVENTSYKKSGDKGLGITDHKEMPSKVQNFKGKGVINHAERKSFLHSNSDQISSNRVKTKSPFLMPPRENIVEQESILVDQQREEQPNVVGIEKKEMGLGEVTSLDSFHLLAKNEEEKNNDANEQAKEDRKGFAKRLYTAIVAGPDVSTVKSQKMSSPGYSIGLLAGYQFNKRFSVETGVLWDHKDYYSTGKYFDKTGLGLPQHAKILDVDGYCNMFEIPVNLKYNWAQKRDYNFFATVGTSSYLMKKEEYDYSYVYYNAQYKYYKQYKNASRNWASILNLSIGFEKKVGNIGNLRIEPYWKLPLNGVGIGDLPLGSKGIFVGLSRPIQ